MFSSQPTQKYSWKTELSGALRKYSDLTEYFNLNQKIELDYDLFIPQNFAQKIKSAGVGSPLWKQFIPNISESSSEGVLDPIGDIQNSKGNGIIHKYSNRILFTPTSACPIICRYCFRKNELSTQSDIFKTNLLALKKYLIQNPQVNEVILTGGDPLMISNAHIENILKLLLECSVPFVRFHTRMPIIIPERLDDAFINLMRDYQDKFVRISFILHTNHIDELSSTVEKMLLKLKPLNIERRTQSVLLKNINDTTDDLYNLFMKILACGFTPYYLHHPDKARGAMHFYLDQDAGTEIYNKLRDKLPGWAIPHYIVDHPHGKSLAST